MSKWEEKEPKKNTNYITFYYDIETTQHYPVEGKVDTYEHKPNLLVCQAVCAECEHVVQNDYFCRVCKTPQQIFHNLNDHSVTVIEQFFNYLQSFPPCTEILLVAHNAKSFDGIFMLQEMIDMSFNHAMGSCIKKFLRSLIWKVL